MRHFVYTIAYCMTRAGSELFQSRAKFAISPRLKLLRHGLSRVCSYRNHTRFGNVCKLFQTEQQEQNPSASILILRKNVFGQCFFRLFHVRQTSCTRGVKGKDTARLSNRKKVIQHFYCIENCIFCTRVTKIISNVFFFFIVTTWL